MAIAKKNPSTSDIQGKLAGLVYAHYEDKVVVRKAPRRKPSTRWTRDQLSEQKDFARAVAYGKRVLADPVKKAAYASLAKPLHRSVFNLALADALTGPAILKVNLAEYTGRSGQPIHIQATDNVEVSVVDVKIQRTTGELLECGAATADPTVENWIYWTKAAVSADEPGVIVEVTAADRPGNQAKIKLDHFLSPHS